MATYSIYPKQFNNYNYKLQANSCFVVMPFSSDLNNTYMVIDSVATSMQIKCTRADKISTTSEPILSKICEQISQAYFIIVDITDLNPNVFYELGIAHVLRDANKVLIIKDEQTICPSDIRHLHYYPYSKSDLKGLKEIVERFFSENNILEDLQSVLNFLDLLPHNNKALAQRFVVNLSNCIGNNIDCLIIILNNMVTELMESQVLSLLSSLVGRLEGMNKSDEMYTLYSALTLLIISKTHLICNLSSCISNLFNKSHPNLTAEWIADCSVIILDSPSYFDCAVSWILGYLQEVSPAAFDIPKYKIELGIIRSKSELIDSLLVRELNSSNKTLAEHCAKLIKERKTYSALPTLLELIEHEDNPYVVRSCIEALVEMAPLNILLNTKKLLADRKELVEKYPFIDKHIKDLDLQIFALQNAANP